MANWVTNWISAPNIGVDLQNKKFSMDGVYNCLDVQSFDQDTIKLDSKWRPPLAAVSQLSKEKYAGQDVVLTYVNEGSSFVETEMRFRDGQLTGNRERYHDGVDEPEPFGDWNPITATESNKLLDDARRLDKREQRSMQAAALCESVSFGDDEHEFGG